MKKTQRPILPAPHEGFTDYSHNRQNIFIGQNSRTDSSASNDNREQISLEENNTNYEDFDKFHKSHRKKANRACLPCQKSHTQCEDSSSFVTETLNFYRKTLL